MVFESAVSSLENQQGMLDRLFTITPETRRRLDAGDLPERELRRVYSRGIKEDPWAFMHWRKDVWWGGAVMPLFNLMLSLLALLVVLGFGKRMQVVHSPAAGPFTVLGVMGASYLIYLALKGIKEQAKSLLKTRRARLPDSRPSLQMIDAVVSTFRYWDSNLGSERGRVLLMSELVLQDIERATPGDAQAVRDGRISLPGFLHPFIIEGRVRIHLIAGVYQSSPHLGSIVSITLFEGASVTEKKPGVEPRSNPSDIADKVCADE